jgi:putative transposase
MLLERMKWRKTAVTDYRRADLEGGYYFFTVVTYNRRPFLTEPLARQCLRVAWKETRDRSYFEMIAVCLLPDHLHCIWRLPEGDCDFSLRWARIKAGFTRCFLDRGGTESVQSPSRDRKRERGLWQRRFWKHQIRDKTDLQRHVDYIHYNPVKHGLVEHVEDWPWSSYHRYLKTTGYSDQYWDGAQSRLKDMSVYE